MAPKITLFLFDLDGTLVTTGGAGLRALATTFKELYGLDEVLAKVRPAGKTDPAIFREVIRTFLNRDMTIDELTTITETYLSHLTRESKASERFKIHSGVKNFLDQLMARPATAFGLGTGNLEKGARIKLEPTGLNSYFKFGGYGSDSENRGELLRIAHDRAESIYGETISQRDTFVIGDTELDVRAARQSGYRAVSVATGARSLEELKNSEPDYLFKDLTEGAPLLV
jgi:phosphoglycolate phosphatase